MDNYIFDMDGTLIDTAKASMLSFAKIAPKYGLVPPDIDKVRAAMGYANPEFFVKIYPGLSGERLRLFGNELDNDENERIAELKQGILFDRVYSMLVALRGRKGRKLYIASTGSARHVKVSLESAGIIHLFDALYYGEPVKIEMVRRIKENDPNGRWLMLGDHFKDSEAARGNGILAVGAGYGYCSSAVAQLFDKVIMSPLDMLRTDIFD